jgi:hypothetical protein
VNDVEDPRIVAERNEVVLAILDTRRNVGVVAAHGAGERGECQDEDHGRSHEDHGDVGAESALPYEALDGPAYR